MMSGCLRRTWSQSSGWRLHSCQQRPRWHSTNSSASHIARRHRHHLRRNEIQRQRYLLDCYQPDTALHRVCSPTWSLSKRQSVPTATPQTFQSSTKKRRTRWKSPVPGSVKWDVDTEATHSGRVDDKLITRDWLERLLKLSNVFWQVSIGS